jgi:hypothetical protein
MARPKELQTYTRTTASQSSGNGYERYWRSESHRAGPPAGCIALTRRPN